MKHSAELKLPDNDLMKEIDTAGSKYFSKIQDKQIRQKGMKENL